MIDGVGTLTLAAFGWTTLVATWLLTYWLHAAVIGGAILLMRRAISRPAMRVVALRMALLAPILTATAAVFAGNGAPHRWRDPFAVVLAGSPRPVDVDANVNVVNGRTMSVVRVTDPIGSRRGLTLCALVALGSLVFAGLHATRRRLGRRRIAGRAAAPAAIVDRVRQASGAVRVTQCAELRSPIALEHDEICVPLTFADIPTDEQSAVLLHELAHVARRDPEWSGAGSWIVAGLWFQPINWWLVDAMRRDAELAADAQALALGARGVSLVAALARIAESMEPPSLEAVGVPFARRPSLVIVRADAALSPARLRVARDRIVLAAVAAGVTILLMMSPVITSAAPPSRAVAANAPAGDVSSVQTVIRVAR